MLKNIWATILSLPLVIFFEPANALDVRIQPRFKTGVQYYEFEQKYIESQSLDPQGLILNTQSKKKFKDWVPFVSGGATLFIDRFFVDFDAQYLFDGKANSDFSNQTYVKSGDNFTTDAVFDNNSEINTDFDRFEYAISVGLEVIDNLAIFGGYKYAKTSFTGDIDGNMDAFQANSNKTTIPQLSGMLVGGIDIEFEYDGPFVGLNYNWRIHQGFMDGSLSFNFAAAFLNSKTKVDLSKISVQSDTGVTSPLPLKDGNNQSITGQFDTLKGNTTGYSFSAGWQGLTFVDNLTYLIGVTGYRYEFKGNKTVENRVRLDFGLAYAFDF